MLKNHGDICIITVSTAKIAKNEKQKFVHFAFRFKSISTRGSVKSVLAKCEGVKLEV